MTETTGGVEAVTRTRVRAEEEGVAAEVEGTIADPPEDPTTSGVGSKEGTMTDTTVRAPMETDLVTGSAEVTVRAVTEREVSQWNTYIFLHYGFVLLRQLNCFKK